MHFASYRSEGNASFTQGSFFRRQSGYNSSSYLGGRHFESHVGDMLFSGSCFFSG